MPSPPSILYQDPYDLVLHVLSSSNKDLVPNILNQLTVLQTSETIVLPNSQTLEFCIIGESHCAIALLSERVFMEVLACCDLDVSHLTASGGDALVHPFCNMQPFSQTLLDGRYKVSVSFEGYISHTDMRLKYNNYIIEFFPNPIDQSNAILPYTFVSWEIITKRRMPVKVLWNTIHIYCTRDKGTISVVSESELIL